MTAAAMTVTANATGDIDVSFPLNGCLRKFGMRRGHAAEDNSENGRKTICNQFRARDGFNALMTGNGEKSFGTRFMPCHRGRQGFDFQATLADGIKSGPET